MLEPPTMLSFTAIRCERIYSFAGHIYKNIEGLQYGHAAPQKVGHRSAEGRYKGEFEQLAEQRHPA